jgi:aspartate/methionine/tyrosine aminotransferase
MAARHPDIFVRMTSRRTNWDLAANAFAARLEAVRAAGGPRLDLTETDPTRVGLAWPAAELAEALSDPRVAGHDPSPQGAPEAREAVAAYLATRGAAVDPARILLTASTSEGYAFLLKLLCDPGDEVLVPAPSYPLLDVLAALEGVGLVRYPLRWDGEWHLDLADLEERIGPRARAVVVISPSNPTGAVLGAEGLRGLDALCARRGLALVGDEVFADTAPGAPSVAGAREALAFHLGGLSKTCGLPQLKVAWIAAAGPQARVAPALARLEVIADAFLSVGAPAQWALPRLLPRRGRFLDPLRARLATNRARLAAAPPGAPWSALPGPGGWSAVIRVGETVDEEALALSLLEDGVAVHPGFLYDFARAGHLVVSLLPAPDRFEEGLRVVEARLARSRGKSGAR